MLFYTKATFINVDFKVKSFKRKIFPSYSSRLFDKPKVQKRKKRCDIEKSHVIKK